MLTRLLLRLALLGAALGCTLRAAAQCPAPVWGTPSSTTTSISVSWTAVPAATTGYLLTWRVYDPNFPTPTTTLSLSGTSLNLSGLTPNTPYELTIRSVCGANTSPAASLIVNTQAPPPPPPGCFSPTITGFSVSPTQIQLTWSASATTTIDGYRIEYRTGAAPFQTVDLGNVLTGTLNGLQPNTLYEVRVRTLCPGNVISNPGPSTFIQTAPVPCPAPLLNTPIPGLNSLFLTWPAVPQAANGYRIEYRPQGATTWLTEDVIGSNVTGFALTGLLSGTVYEVRLQARCSATLNSAFSPVVTAATLGLNCPTPTFTSVVPTQTEIALSWTPVPAAALGYRVEFRTGSSAWSGFDLGPTQTSTTLTGLQPGTTYEVRVQSRCNASLSSPFTTTNVATQSICPAPLLLSPDIGPNSLNVRWVPQPAATGYRLTWRLASGGPTSTQIVPAASTQFTIGGLLPATAYLIELQSLCNTTPSVAASQVVTTQSAVGCPGPIIRRIEPTANSLLVVFGGTNVPHLGYRLEYRRTDSPNLPWTGLDLPPSPTLDPSQNNTYALTGLPANTSFDIRLRTRCPDGSASGWDLRTAQTLPAACPAPVIQNIWPGLNSISLTWTGPQNQVFVQEYRLFYRELPAGNPQVLFVPSFQTFATITQGILPGRDYEISLRTACSLVDESVPVQRIVRTLGVACAVPSVPTVVASFRTAQVSWSVPASTPLISFTVEYRRLSDPNWTTRQTGGTALTLDNLQPGTTYELRVRTNCQNGSFSEFASTIFATQEPVCRSPDALQVLNATPTSVSLVWDAVPEFGLYQLEWRVQSDPFAPWSGVVVSGTSFTIENLQSATDYLVRLRTVCGTLSENNFSPYTFAFARTLDPPCPAVQLTAVQPLANSILLTWNPVPDAASGYRVRWKRTTDANFTQLDLPFVITSYEIVNLQPSTAYNIEVQSLCSPTRVASPTARTVTTLAAFCPAPVIQATSPDNESILVIWPAVPDAAAGYVVSWRPVAGAFQEQIVASTTTSFRITGLQPATTYEVRLRSRCTPTSVSDWSASVSVTTTSTCPPPNFIDLVSEAFALNVRWGAVSGAQGYRVNWGLPGQALTGQVDLPATATLFRIDNLNPDTEYEVQVRTRCIGNALSEPNIGFEFTTADFCVPPTNLNLTADVDRITVTWNPVAAADNGYVVEWRVLSGAWRSVVVTQNVFVIENLLPNTAYEVRVFSRCGPRSSSLPVLSTIVTLAANACPSPTITLVTPLTNGAQVSWTPIAAAALGYAIEWQAQLGGSWQEAFVAANQTSYVIGGLASATAYRVRVRSRCALGDESAPSSLREFTTLSASDCPAPLITTFSATPTAINVQWTIVTAAVGYRIEYAPVNNPAAMRIVEQQQPFPSLLVHGLMPGTAYSFRVFARCRTQISAPSPVQVITTPEPRQAFAETTPASSWQLYPNPNRGAFVVRFDAEAAGEAAFVLLSLDGREVGRQVRTYAAGSVELDFDFGPLPAGLYLLRRVGEPTAPTLRVVIE